MDLSPCTLIERERPVSIKMDVESKLQDVLISLDVARDLVLKPEWNSVKCPGNRSGICSLRECSCQGSGVSW